MHIETSMSHNGTGVHLFLTYANDIVINVYRERYLSHFFSHKFPNTTFVMTKYKLGFTPLLE